MSTRRPQKSSARARRAASASSPRAAAGSRAAARPPRKFNTQLPEPRFDPELWEEFCQFAADHALVTRGRMFGFPALLISPPGGKRKLLALAYGHGVAIKLPEEVAQARVALGEGSIFRPYGLSPAREWLLLAAERRAPETWRDLLEMSIAFTLLSAERTPRQATAKAPRGAAKKKQRGKPQPARKPRGAQKKTQRGN